jgi:hypothetical protein
VRKHKKSLAETFLLQSKIKFHYYLQEVPQAAPPVSINHSPRSAAAGKKQIAPFFPARANHGDPPRVIWCETLFFCVASDEKSRQKKNKLHRFFLSRLSRSVAIFVFVPCGAMAR